MQLGNCLHPHITLPTEDGEPKIINLTFTGWKFWLLWKGTGWCVLSPLFSNFYTSENQCKRLWFQSFIQCNHARNTDKFSQLFLLQPYIPITNQNFKQKQNLYTIMQRKYIKCLYMAYIFLNLPLISASESSDYHKRHILYIFLSPSFPKSLH